MDEKMNKFVNNCIYYFQSNEMTPEIAIHFTMSLFVTILDQSNSMELALEILEKVKEAIEKKQIKALKLS